MAGKRTPVIDGHRVCSHCGKRKPFDAQHFLETPDYYNGGRRLNAECLDCARSRRKAYAATERGRLKRRTRERERYRDDADYKAKRLATVSSWSKRTRADRNAYKRKWYRDHREAYQAWTLSGQKRRRAAEGRFTPQDVHAIYCEQDGCCYYCGRALRDGYHIDHMQPIARGGSNWPSNLVLACASCNLSKGARTSDEFLIARLGT